MLLGNALFYGLVRVKVCVHNKFSKRIGAIIGADQTCHRRMVAARLLEENGKLLNPPFTKVYTEQPGPIPFRTVAAIGIPQMARDVLRICLAQGRSDPDLRLAGPILTVRPYLIGAIWIKTDHRNVSCPKAKTAKGICTKV